MHRVKKMPNCAAAPNIISLGFDKSGLKSIIAPMPTNKSRGKSSFDTPALKSTSRRPFLQRLGDGARVGQVDKYRAEAYGQEQRGLHLLLMAR